MIYFRVLPRFTSLSRSSHVKGPECGAGILAARSAVEGEQASSQTSDFKGPEPNI